jgi:hypothetical protein
MKSASAQISRDSSSPRENGRRRFLTLGLGVTLTLSACSSGAPATDSTPPTTDILAMTQDQATQGQGAQYEVLPGGQVSVSSSWLGPQKANIRVYGNDDEGVKTLVVTGTATGKCWTADGNYGQAGLTASFPNQTQTSAAGTVANLFAVDIDDLISNASCGSHKYANMETKEEFFFLTGTWTITSHVENCCGGKVDGTFTIVVS